MSRYLCGDLDVKEELDNNNLDIKVNNKESEAVNYEIVLAERLQLSLNEIPLCLRQRAARILEVLDGITVDDPIIFIEWTNPWPCGRVNTKRHLINDIVNGGGTNEFNSDTIFSFQTCRQLGNWINNRPAWLVTSFIIFYKYWQCSSNFLGKHRSKRDRGANPRPDVGHMYRISKVTDRIAELEDAAYVFND
ncbi:hypothetical protein RclHR1_06040004 [Rhizophagus clarus]|uniref:Uncharacterized protein n=1 Tax=Rhizophagus clarus TaxID=94130 RepID=A0A2Z6RW67_9GLOM|nr:hypothetical protein RclHR1_06040004 [Rhizophagus clarus]